jgi:dethiobiotin synthetase
MKSARVIWLTGTNTGVGKTFLAAEIAKVLSQTSLNFKVLKPFCSGGREDVEILGAAQGLGENDLKQINLYSLKAALAPALAAEMEGIETCLETSTNWIKQRLVGQEMVIIEGAGGVLAPLGYNWTLVDLIRNIPGDIWIVARNELGVLNSLFLTINELRKLYCDVEAGWELKVFLMDPPENEKDQATELNSYLFSRFEPEVEAVCVNFLSSYLIDKEEFMDSLHKKIKKHLSDSEKSLD